jgi:hypothetical protein
MCVECREDCARTRKLPDAKQPKPKEMLLGWRHWSHVRICFQNGRLRLFSWVILCCWTVRSSIPLRQVACVNRGRVSKNQHTEIRSVHLFYHVWHLHAACRGKEQAPISNRSAKWWGSTQSVTPSKLNETNIVPEKERIEQDTVYFNTNWSFTCTFSSLCSRLPLPRQIKGPLMSLVSGFRHARGSSWNQ